MVITRQLTDSASASTASDIQLGSCVTEIGQGAFSGYTNITDVEFPDGLTTIGVGAFSGSSVTSVEFPNSLTSIDASAFAGCYGLETIDIPDSVTTIGNYAFNFPLVGTSLTECTIGTGVTSIGEGAFNGQDNMRKLTIKATTPPTLGNNSLDGTYLIYVPYESYNDYITASGWVKYKDRIVYSDVPYKAIFLNATGGSENFIPCNSTSSVTRTEVNNAITTATTKVRFGGCVTTIGDGYTSPFSGNSTINEVEFSNSITAITNYVFQNTSGGIHISSFPSSITTFGNYAFFGTESGRITIDNLSLDGQYSIGVGTFRNCNIGNLYFNLTANTSSYSDNIFESANITRLTFGNDVTTIPSGMCYNGTGITALTLPSNVTEVKYNAFYRHQSLKNVVFQGNTSRIIGQFAFSRSIISSITIPNISSVGANAFSFTTGLTNFNASSSADAVVNWNIISQETFGYVDNGFETLEIGANVNEIQANAFYSNNNLKKVHIIGNSSTVIRGTSPSNGAFGSCSALTEVQIDNAASIGQYAFSNSNAIEKITINGGYPSIDNMLFANKTSLSSLTLNGITSVGEHSFGGCTSLTNLELPSTLQSIGASAFTNCSGIQTLIIPSSITSIGNSAFSGCSSLTSILIGRTTPPTIGTNVFNGSNCLIYVPQEAYDLYVNAQNWQAYRDRIFAVGTEYKAILIGSNTRVINCNNNTTLSLSEVGTNNATTINIGNCVTEIGASAFTGSSSAQTVSIPRSVTTIGNRAFYNRRMLTTVSGMEGVTTIGNGAFYNCSGLTSVTLPDSLQSVNQQAFYGCNGLTTLTIPSGVTSIGNSAFQSNALTSVTFEGLTPPTIQGKTMTGYDSLFNKRIPIYVPCAAYNDYITAWTTYSSSSGRLIDYLVPNGQYTKDEEVSGFLCENGNKYKKIAHYVSSDNTNWCLTHYYAGDLITEGDSDCSPYLHLEYANNCGTVCENSGYTYTKYCYETTSTTVGYDDIPYASSYVSAATFGDCVTTIDTNYSFGNRLKSVTFGNSLTTIGDSVFYNCSGLTSVTIPSSITSIGNEAFKKCSGLTSIDIPDACTSIGDSAFENGSALTAVTIGSGITSIGYSAFDNCLSLVSITINAATPPSIGNEFYNIGSCVIYVPSASLEAYRNAMRWSNMASRIQAIPNS